MDDDMEQWRYETETGQAQVDFCLNRLEETRSAMLEAKHRFWLASGSKPEKWIPASRAYWTALDNWQAAIQDLDRARKEVDRGPF